MSTIKRSIIFYNENKEEWNRLVKNAMRMDFSWDRSAKKYMELYEKVIKKEKCI